MRVEGIAPLEIHISGEPESGINPTWRGQVTADTDSLPYCWHALVKNLW